MTDSPQSKAGSMLTLPDLLDTAVTANRSQRRTLTLILSSFLEPRFAFFRDLATHWNAVRSDLGLSPETVLDIDWCITESTRFDVAHLTTRLRLRAWTDSDRSLRGTHGVRIARCMVVGKPDETRRVVLGIASPAHRLPNWAMPITIG